MESLNGIIIINKEKGYTSHDVVARVRRLLSVKKAGHAGTLDPGAEGVLPICVGRATKASNMLMESSKEYTADVLLGTVTDTQDIYGMVVEKNEVPHYTEQQLINALSHFTGKISQVPPMYSALKIGGKKLCDLARQGIEVERKPRDVTVYSIDVKNVTENGFSINVVCSKGTYIRTLCHDIGQYLGCGACVESLTRTKTSGFSIENSLTLAQLEKLVNDGKVNEAITPVDSVFAGYPSITVNDETALRLRNGALSTVREECGKYRVYDASGQFIAVGDVSCVNGRNKIGSVKYFGNTD